MAKKSKQSIVYDYYMDNPDKTIGDIAEKFNVTYKTIANMLWLERKRRNVTIKRDRYR